MIPAPNTLTQIDEIEGEEIEFGIGDPRWVMRTQAELYSDVTTAIIREYSTNAWDANVMADNPEPIRVTLPTIFNNSIFTIEDKGVGMDITDFRETYTQFGISDKRERMDTNGQLGYGSKSGLAYTDQFTVTSIKDGHKITGLVMRKPDWSIVLKVVTSVKTDEPNGTTIRIPVHNIDEFKAKAMEFYKYWLPGRVEVDGEPVEHYVGEKIADNLYYSKHWNTSYVVMGNVPYRINNPAALFANTKMSALNFVAYVDSFKTEDEAQPVEFTPSREDLKYTERTKRTLQAIINQFEVDIVTKAQSDISNAANHYEAFQAYTTWTKALGTKMFEDLTYKGDKFEPEFAFRGYRYEKNSSHNSVRAIRDWSVDAMHNTVVVTEFDINVSSSVKARAKAYVAQQDWKCNYILFTADPASAIVSKWITKDKFVKWADLKAALPVVPRTYNGGGYNPNFGRIRGSWDYFTSTGVHREQTIPTDAKRIYWISVRGAKAYNVSYILQLMGDTEAVVLLVPGNRQAKLLRENPKITEFTTWAKSKVVADGASLVPQKVKDYHAVSDADRSWANRLDLSRVDDPKFKEFVFEIDLDKEMLAHKNMKTLAQAAREWYTFKQYTRPPADTFYVNEHYPLLSNVREVSDHVYLYLNAAYAAELENNS